MKFLKGSRDEFEKLKNESSWDDKAEIIRRQMAEVFGSKNLSFLMGSGCSSLRQGGDELGIPTMKFLAEEFQALLAPDAGAGQTFVSAAQKTELYDKLGSVILPLYYQDRTRWLWMMKQSISKIGTRFSSHTMMRRYASEAYLR